MNWRWTRGIFASTYRKPEMTLTDVKGIRTVAPAQEGFRVHHATGGSNPRKDFRQQLLEHLRYRATDSSVWVTSCAGLSVRRRMKHHEGR